MKLNPIATSDYPTPVERPKNSVLDCTKIKAKLRIDQANWNDELGLVLDKIKS